MLASQARGGPGGQVDVKDFMEENSKLKEVLVSKENELDKKDKALEKKKETIKKQKLELIELKEEMKGLKKDVQVIRPEEKKKDSQKKAAEVSQQKKDDVQCTKCNKKEKSKSDLMIHMDMVHKEHEELVNHAQNDQGPALAQEGEACRNGDNCSWKRNNKCKFVHTRKPNVESHNRNIHSKEEPPMCTNGPNCGYKKNGACKFTHHQGKSHDTWQKQPRQHGFRKHNNREHREEEEPVRTFRNVRNPAEPVGWCLDGDNCSRNRYCMYKHTRWQQVNLASFQMQASQSRN